MRAEQEEVLQIFNKIEQETGWRVGFVYKELKEKWGWIDGQMYQSKEISRKSPESASSQRQYEAQQQSRQQKIAVAVMQHASQDILHQSKEQQSKQNLEEPLSNNQIPQVQPQNGPSVTLSRLNHRRIGGILNPTLASADFSMAQHPFQSHYVAPNAPNMASQSHTNYITVPYFYLQIQN